MLLPLLLVVVVVLLLLGAAIDSNGGLPSLKLGIQCAMTQVFGLTSRGGVSLMVCVSGGLVCC